ncbi:hypothetical protein PENTCL1PPCAC_13651, partial [Pristionchus entomophagus]
ARTILFLLLTVMAISLGCIRMEPTSPGIPAMPATEKPFVCPSLLPPPDISGCEGTVNGPCGPAVIEPLKASCTTGSMYVQAGAFMSGGNSDPFLCDTVRKTWTDAFGKPLSEIGAPANTQIYVACVL